MKASFTTAAWNDYCHWAERSDPKAGRIDRLIENCMARPAGSIGNPKPLFAEKAGWWSRRIDGEHRLVYRVAGTKDDPVLEIAQCRFHY